MNQTSEDDERKDINMQGFEKFSTVEQKRKFTNAGPSGLHPARRENLRCLGSTEEQFVQGLRAEKTQRTLEPAGRLMSLD